MVRVIDELRVMKLNILIYLCKTRVYTFIVNILLHSIQTSCASCARKLLSVKTRDAIVKSSVAGFLAARDFPRSARLFVYFPIFLGEK